MAAVMEAISPAKHMPGWWLTYPSLKHMKVNRDDEIPNTWKNKSHVSHVPNHQPNAM